MIYRVFIFSYKEEVIPELTKDFDKQREANKYGREDNAPLVYQVIEVED